MNIVIGSDHAAIDYRMEIIEHLKSSGHNVYDVGVPVGTKASDYPDIAVDVANMVVQGKAQRGIVLCGTGIGISIAANKVKGIRCALCSNEFGARAARLHNDANVLALGQRTTGLGVALDMVDIFVGTKFSGDDRHARRIDKIE